MKLILIGLALLAFPIVTWVAEWHESDEQYTRRTVNWMADHDRSTQAVRPINRRMVYTTTCKKCPRRHGNAKRRQGEKVHLMISRIGGAVNG